MDLVGNDNLEQAVLGCLDNEDPNVLRAACYMSGALGLAGAERGLLQALTHKAWQVQAEAARALGLIGSKGSLPFLRRLLKASANDLRQKVLSAAGGDQPVEEGESHPALKRAAAVAISRIDPAVAEEALSAALGSGQPNLMNAAMAGLANLESGRGVKTMIGLLSHQDAGVRRTAAAGLGKLRAVEAVDPLLGVLDDSDAGVRREAVIALNHLKNNKAIVPLVSRLSDSDHEVRRVAVIAMGNTRSRDEQVVQGLMAALKDREAAVRRSALAALANLRADSALERAALLLNDSHEDVRRQAAATVLALGQVRERPDYTPENGA